jgi:hypothetical protein
MERALRVPPAIAPKVLELAACSTAKVGSKTDASDWYSSTAHFKSKGVLAMD